MEELLQKYVRNECSREERQRVMDWLQNPANEMLLRGWMWQQWSASPVKKVPPAQYEPLWTDIARLTHTDSPRPTLAQNVRHQLLRTAIWIGCILAIGLLIRLVRYYQTPPEAVYQTGPKQHMKVLLPDHSIVMLNSNSTLRVSPDWSETKRSIRLDGEAFFYIVRQPYQFRVRIRLSKQMQLETVYGAFLVSRWSGAGSVTAHRGSAELHIQHKVFSNHQVFSLLPGDQYRYTHQGSQVTKRKINSTFYPYWLRRQPDFVVDLQKKL